MAKTKAKSVEPKEGEAKAATPVPAAWWWSSLFSALLAVVVGTGSYAATTAVLGSEVGAGTGSGRGEAADWNAVSSTRRIDEEGAQAVPCAVDRWLSDVPTPGLHVLCVEPAGSASALALSVYPLSRNETEPQQWLLELPAQASRGIVAVRRSLEERLQLEARTLNPWAIFDATGRAIDSVDRLLAAPVALVYEGGRFIWPGVRVGHRQPVTLDGGARTVTMETLSLQPLVFSIDDFLTLDECDYIRQHAEPHMAQSGVSLMDKDKGKAATNWRTSSTYFMPSKQHSVLQQVDTRVAELTAVPHKHQELVQVLRYEDGQKYDAHHDYFDKRLYAKDAHTLALTAHGRKNRMATVLWYLSDVDGGGETIFPQSGGRRPPTSMAACDVGLKVAPRKGRVIMFYSLLPNGDGDRFSLHGACPVHGDKPKWAANKWVWSAPIDFGGY